MHDTRTIFHVDMDSFFASVEQQARPELRGIPIAVSGDPKSRTVVAAASREAKRFGVRSGMAIHDARSRCPQIRFILGDPDKYVHISRAAIDIFHEFSDQVEIWSIDEAFLDVTGWVASHACDVCQEQSERRHRTDLVRSCGAITIAREIKQRFLNVFGPAITCSIGIAPNKRLAKAGSDFYKPDGTVFVFTDTPPTIHSIAGERVRLLRRDHMLNQLDLGDLCGIGARIESRLHSLGIATVGQLATTPVQLLVEHFGMHGATLHDMAIGNDDAAVVTEDAAPKSVGHGATLPRNLLTIDEVGAVVAELAEKVAARLRRYDFLGGTIHATLRYHRFTSHTEQKALAVSTDDGLRIGEVAMNILRRWPWTHPVRYVGIRVSGLIPARPAQASVFPHDERWQRAVRSMDCVNARYGDWTVQRGSVSLHERFLRKVAAAFRATRHLKEGRTLS
jgi:DNA polymerase IV